MQKHPWYGIDLRARDSLRAAGWAHADPEQNLGCVDIPNSGDDSLVHDQVLDRHAPPAGFRGQVIGVEIVR